LPILRGAREGWPSNECGVTFGRQDYRDHGEGDHMTAGHARCATSAMIALAAALSSAPDLAAQALSSGETARLLAPVEATDGRCGYLGRADQDALKTFAARAEIAAAGEGGPQEASAAVASGRAEGGSAACDEQSARLVRSAYAAAQYAASGARRGQAA